jgi:hydroxypyruvate isomerase
MPLRLAANLSWLFKEVPFLQRFGRASACGFTGCEFLFDQYDHEPERVREAIKSNGLTPALLNCPPGHWAAGERGTGGLPDREVDFKHSIERGLQYAKTIGCPKIHAMAGLVVGDRSACEARFVERLQWASAAAASEGIEVCIEPLNGRDVPNYLLPDTTSALRVLEAVGHDNCKLQLDLYHLQVSEGDLSTRVEEVWPSIGHIQIANPPGRHEPGAGEVDFRPLFSLLDRLGYSGWVGCEYVPSTATTEESLHWAREFGIVAKTAE